MVRALQPRSLGHPAAHGLVQRALQHAALHHLRRGAQHAGVYEGRDWYLVQTENVDLPDRASEERLMQQAWKRFYDTVAVEARYNPELRRQFMPKRFWKNITEMQEDLPGKEISPR